MSRIIDFARLQVGKSVNVKSLDARLKIIEALLGLNE